MQEKNLNLIPSGDMPVIYASQYDKNRVIRFNLFEGEDEYTLSGTEIVKCNIRKNDEHIVVITPTIGANKYIDVYLTEQACACFGSNIGEITISSDEDTLIGTINFILEVERNPIQGGVTSETDIDDLTGQIEDIVHEVMSDDYYTRDEVDAKLDLKANAADVYTKAEVDTALSSKANTADVYTKAQVDTALGLKADKADTYTKSQVDTALALKANAADVYTKTEVDEMIDELYPVNTASGSIATFDTSLALPLVAMSAEIVAQQAGTGTASPSNQRAINGFDTVDVYHRGANLWEEEWESGSFNTSGEPTPNADWSRTINFIPVKSSTYVYAYIEGITSSNNAWIFSYDKNKAFIKREVFESSRVFGVPANACFIKFQYKRAIADITNYKVSINFPSTQTAYVPYNPQSETKTITLPSTIYGGKIDIKNGSATKTLKYFTFSEAQYYGTYGSDNANLYYVEILDYDTERIKTYASSAFPDCIMISNMFVKNTSSASGMLNNQIRTNTGAAPQYFYFRADEFADLTALNAFLAVTPLQVVAELQTPTEITGLTGVNFTTFAGEQNIFSDSGDISVSFKQGIQEYIDSKIGG